MDKQASREPQGPNIFLPGLSINRWQPDPAVLRAVDESLEHRLGPTARTPEQWLQDYRYA